MVDNEFGAQYIQRVENFKKTLSGISNVPHPGYHPGYLPKSTFNSQKNLHEAELKTWKDKVKALEEKVADLERTITDMEINNSPTMLI